MEIADPASIEIEFSYLALLIVQHCEAYAENV
jgi:hypothetical protein